MAKTLTEARQEVARLYIASFNRVADTSGLNYWVSAYLNGLSLQSMANDFMNSLEGVTKYPTSMSNSAFLDAIYQNVFGRAPDNSGKAFWEAALVAGTSRATFIDTVINAALANNSNDGAMLNNKAAYGVYCAVNAITPESAAATLLTITHDSATLEAASKTNLGFSLTTGTDGLNGGTGNDTFTGTVLTTQAADIVNGSSGSDTLELDGTVIIPILSSVETVSFKNTTGQIDISSKSGVTALSIASPTGNSDYIMSSQTLSMKSAATPYIYNLKYASTAKTAAIALNGVGASGSKSTFNLATGTGLATVELTADTGASYITLENSGYSPITKLSIMGASALTVDVSDTSATKLKTIDASTNSGGVTLGLANMADFAYSVVGGLGADMFNFGNRLGADDKVEGGSLADTIQVIGTATSTTDANLKSIEYITLSGETLLTLTSQTENFVITGSSYNDTVVSGLGADTISTGSGDDMIYVASGGSIYKIIDGGDGTDTIVVAGTFDKVGDSRVSNVEKIMLQKTSTTTTTTTSTTGITVDISDQTEELIIISSIGNDTVTMGAGADTFQFASTAALNGVDTIKSFDTSADSFDITAFLNENSVGNNSATTAISWTATATGLNLKSGKNTGVIYNKTTAFVDGDASDYTDTVVPAAVGKIGLDDNGKALIFVTSDTDGIGDSVISSYALYFLWDEDSETGTTDFQIKKVGTISASTEYNAADLASANFI